MGAHRTLPNRCQGAAATTRDQMFLMLQSLLESRFQLKTHNDTKELPVFALVPAKAGLKLLPPKEGVCVDSPAEAAAEWAGGGRMAAPEKFRRLRRCQLCCRELRLQKYSRERYQFDKFFGSPEPPPRPLLNISA